MNLDEILIGYEKYLKLKSIQIFPAYLSTVKEFLAFLEERNLSPAEATTGIGEDYLAYLLREDKSLSRGTINNKLNRVRSFYRFLLRKRLIYENPFTRVCGLKTGRSLPKNILSVKDMGILLDSFGLKKHSDFMMRSIIEFLYGSALRASEVRALKDSDLDFKTTSITITDFKNGCVRRKCPATEVSMKIAKEYLKTFRDTMTTPEEREKGFLYPQRGETSLRCMLNNKLKRECLRLGLKEITTHCFRHSAATHMLRGGAGIREVQALLGHSKITSTEVYTHVVKEDLKRVVACCHPRERTREKSIERTVK